MTRALLVMSEKIFSQCLRQSLEGDFQCYIENNYERAAVTANLCRADVVLIDMPFESREKLEKIYGICKEIRQENPGCKLMLMCAPDGEAASQSAINAKKNKIIDDFVYYDTSWKYLFSKLRAI